MGTPHGARERANAADGPSFSDLLINSRTAGQRSYHLGGSDAAMDRLDTSKNNELGSRFFEASRLSGIISANRISPGKGNARVTSDHFSLTPPKPKNTLVENGFLARSLPSDVLCN